MLQDDRSRRKPFVYRRPALHKLLSPRAAQSLEPWSFSCHCMRVWAEGRRARLAVSRTHSWKPSVSRRFNSLAEDYQKRRHGSDRKLTESGHKVLKFASSFGGVPPPNRREHHEHQRPAPGATGGPGHLNKARKHRKYRVFRVFFVCFHTHLLSGHCRASTVSIIDDARETHPRARIMSPSFLQMGQQEQQAW